MGLLLSILISCVGVAELLAFYTNVRRIAEPHSTNNMDFGGVTQHYLKELSRERNRLLREIALLENKSKESSECIFSKKQNAVSRSVNDGSNNQDNVAKSSHDEIFFSKNPCMETNQQSNSTEMYISDMKNIPHTAQTPRNATDIKTVNYVQLQNTPNDVPISSEISVISKEPEEASSDITGEKHISHIFPSYVDGSLRKIVELPKANEEIHVIVSADSSLPKCESGPKHDKNILISENVSHSQFERPTVNVVDDQTQSLYSFENVSRPSDAESISEYMHDVDEGNYKSQSPRCGEKHEDILRSNFDNPDFWNNSLKIRKSRSRSRTPEILLQNRLDFEEKSRSKSPIPTNESEAILTLQKSSKSEEELVYEANLQTEEHSTYNQLVERKFWRRSPSPFQKILDIYENTNTDNLDSEDCTSGSSDVTVIDLEEDKIDEDMLNSVDGISKHKQSNEDTKRQFKNKKRSKKENKRKTNETKQTVSENTNSVVAGNAGSGYIETKPEEEAGPSKKSGEPFWLIFSGEYTKAMNKDWHGQHFCCWQCDESLTGQRYVLRDEHPYCVSCYESVFANGCEKCNKIIGIDSKDLSYKDKHWHEACFLCTACGESLVDKQFGSRADRIYCGRCYDEKFASRCDGCGEIFRAGTKKMEYKTRQWHEKCFCCVMCKTPIGTQSFIPREQEIYCAKCYEEKYATRCIKCNKVITSGGVTYKNEPWHRECFTCTNCQTSLAGARFTSRDDKPYCADCFGELFAKRCFACHKPITGIGGTKFISFEDRHWHNDCFFCASCRTSLVGKGFITDQEDIICPECAKQKLM